MLQHKFHCKRFFFSLSLNTPHTYCCCTSSIAKEFHFFFSLSLNTPHTYTSSPQLPQLSSLNVISTLKYKIKLFFPAIQPAATLQFNQLYNSTRFFFLSLPQFPQASTLFLYSSISPLFSFGKLSLAALKNSFSRTSFEQKKSLLFCALF
jgi:hypothetical protein